MRLAVALVVLSSCAAASRPSPTPPPTPEAPAIDAGNEAPTALPRYENEAPTALPPYEPIRGQVPVPAAEASEPSRPAATPAEEKACAARGGKIEPVCMLGALTCVLRYRDGGKRCTDKKDCTGACLYEGPRPAPPKPVGVCQRTSDPCGCMSFIVNGRALPPMCVD